MLPDVLVALIQEFCHVPQNKLDLNRLVKYAYREWVFSKGKPEKHCHHDIWTRSYYSPVEYYVDAAEWNHLLGMFLLYDHNFTRERNHLKNMWDKDKK